ncbi:MAG: sugar phosphate isomerase/epimerase [Spirochaetales bacterium]|nr:sugar phosphate isomerase/epimerase [Spirochaetales bacterium]
MASQIKGPAIFIAQFATPDPPRNNIDNFATWAAGYGYKGLQLPAWDPRFIDLDKAAESKTYCDEYAGKLKEKGLVVTDMFALQGQMIAFHPAFDELFAGFHPKGLKGQALVEWAQGELKKCVKASVHLGCRGVPTLSGGLYWPFVYPWPQRPAGIVETAYKELAERWKPVLDFAHENGKTINFEIHPGCDIFDGATFDMFLEHSNNHPAACINYDPSHFVLQQLDLYEFIKVYADRIKGVHVKDGEFVSSAKQGVYSGMQSWGKRAGRFRTVGDGQVDFRRMFTLLTEIGYDGWAVLEWEDPIRDAEDAAKRCAAIIEDNLIEVAAYAFDNFLDSGADEAANRRILGIK